MTIRFGSRQITESYYHKLLAVQPLARAALARLDRSLPVEPAEPMKVCKKCGESWPATSEFFNRKSGTHQLRSPCRACIDDQRRASLGKPCAVPGCDQPRCTWRSSYCCAHRYGSVAYFAAKTEQEVE